MRKLIFAFLALFAISQVALSLAPVTVVVRDDGMNLSVQLINTSNDEVLYSEDIDEDNVTTNGSGYATFIIGEDDPDWGSLSSNLADNTNIVVRIKNSGSTLEDQRFDEVATTSARSAQSPGNFNVGEDLGVGGDMGVGGDFTVEGDGSFDGNFMVGGIFSYYTPEIPENEFEDESAGEVGAILNNIFVFIDGADDDIQVDADDDLNSGLPDNATYTFIHANDNDNDYYLRIEDSFGNRVWLYEGDSITLIKINGKFHFQQPIFYGG